MQAEILRLRLRMTCTILEANLRIAVLRTYETLFWDERRKTDDEGPRDFEDPDGLSRTASPSVVLPFLFSLALHKIVGCNASLAQAGFSAALAEVLTAAETW